MKFIQPALVLLLLAIFFASCSNSSFLEDYSESKTTAKCSKVYMERDSLHKGMLRIHSNGAFVTLGSGKTTASVKDRNLMKVRFTYDFSIAQNEFTCGEFTRTLKKNSKKDEKDNLPMTMLTYYDMVLIANARSKKEGYDTAYTYSSVVYNENLNAMFIEGLSFHPEVDAYRLPTESEWMLVASQNFDVENSWNNSNSDFKLHDICSFRKDSLQMCDMAGNAMEWVNDWMCNLKDTVLQNFVGASDGGNLDERILKGGSYRSSPKSINTYSRTDVYTVTSSTIAEYLGGRLAFGAIPNAVWLENDGNLVESPMRVLANSVTLKSKMQSFRNKLVFRNDVSGNLAFVDYSSSVSSVVEIDDTLDCYHPDISPDGKWVAFSTRLEGTHGLSSVFVRHLDSAGSNLVKLDVKSANIPRWRILSSGDTVLIYVTSADNNENYESWKRESTWRVPFSKAKFGMPEKMLDGSYHGGVTPEAQVAVTGNKLFRTRKAYVDGTIVDSVWYSFDQVCNVSLSNTGNKNVLFLDFGGKMGREFAHEKYDAHERLLMVNVKGELRSAIPSPKGFTFDHTEWTSNSKYAVATLVNSNGAHRKIVLVNVSDSSIVDLLEGDEVWHPCFWSMKREIRDDSLDLDSAGIYLLPTQSTTYAKLRVKMEMFWRDVDKVKVFLVGSSRMEMGVSPLRYDDLNMLNMGVTSIDPYRDFYLIENYILNHGDSAFAVVVSLDLDNWKSDCCEGLGFFKKSPGYVYDANHDFWKDSIPHNFADVVSGTLDASPGERKQYDSKGGVMAGFHSWDENGVECVNDSNYTSKDFKALEKIKSELVHVIKLASRKKIHIIGIVFPQAPQYAKTGCFGRYGMRRTEAKRQLKWLDSLSRTNHFFTLMDENRMGNHDYPNFMAYDCNHLSYLGASQMTDRLKLVLDSLQKN